MPKLKTRGTSTRSTSARISNRSLRGFLRVQALTLVSQLTYDQLSDTNSTPENKIPNYVTSLCFNAFKTKYPDTWGDIIGHIEETQTCKGGGTVQARSRLFAGAMRKIIKICSVYYRQEGFNFVVGGCGNIVNQDAGLGMLYSTDDLTDVSLYHYLGKLRLIFYYFHSFGLIAVVQQRTMSSGISKPTFSETIPDSM